jgi:LytS/YehU family sensor histidine kinase
MNGMAAGMLSQAAVAGWLYSYGLVSGQHGKPMLYYGPTILANGFGMILMTMVFNDAWVRVNSERHRLDAVRAKALATQSQLIALRARIHPHFLYNALASIAGLCGIAPAEAEKATVRLGDLMRRTLEASATATVPLSTELEHVRVYLSIEQQRLGARLTVNWDIDDSSNGVDVPPLCLQTLVENAINHGIAPKIEPGRLTITTRHNARSVLLAVADNGTGMTAEVRGQVSGTGEAAVHGMPILSSQLEILYGKSQPARRSGGEGCRLALFSWTMKHWRART